MVYLDLPLLDRIKRITDSCSAGGDLGLVERGRRAAVLFLWLTNAVLTYGFPIMLDITGLTGSYLVFFVLGLGCIAFLWKMLPNTSGRSLEELEDAFSGNDFH